jgi:hypothetical protein
MATKRMSDPDYWVVPPNYIQMDGIRSSHMLLGPDLPSTPRIVVLEMQPGFILPRHHHGCARFEMIVKGSLHAGDEVLHPGDIMTADANETYGPKVAGPDGCVTVELFADQQSSGSRYELDDGSFYALDTTSGDRLPDNLARLAEAVLVREEVLAQREGGAS